MLLPFPRKLGTRPSLSPAAARAPDKPAPAPARQFCFFIPSSMFPAYFACLPRRPSPLSLKPSANKSCHTHNRCSSQFSAQTVCPPPLFPAAPHASHLAGLLTHTSGLPPRPSSLLGFPNDRLSPMRSDSCLQCRAASFLLPVSLCPRTRKPASRHKIAVSCYQSHYTVRPDIYQVLSCGQACSFLQHLASLARQKTISPPLRAPSSAPGGDGASPVTPPPLAFRFLIFLFLFQHTICFFLLPPPIISPFFPSPQPPPRRGFSAGSVFFSFASVR